MSDPAHTIVSAESVTKRFGTFTALDDVSVAIRPGEFFSLLGPSGCGKTTLLRMIAGFEAPTEGRILIDGADMAGRGPNKRPVNMVFQSYAVFPHMSVADNVAYGLKVDRVPRATRDERVAEALAQVQMTAFAHRKPDQLSGGQRQRVALARALVKRPRVLLLDEPLSALDAKLRDQMRLELVNLQCDLGITFVMVTHDQSEALGASDRIAVMDHGRIVQIASPEDIYHRPATRFVADFVGRINMLPERLGGGGVRPENVVVSFGEGNAGDEGGEGDGWHEAAMGDLAFSGDQSVAELRVPGGDTVLARLTGETADAARSVPIGAAVRWRFREADRLRFE